MVKLSNKTAGYQHKQADYTIPVAGTDSTSAITVPGSDVWNLWKNIEDWWACNRQLSKGLRTGK